MPDDLFKAYELYLADRTRLATAKAEAAKSYDQTILTFSAGAVALSITFLEKLIQRPAVTWLLYLAWILFGVAILATLYSLLASQRACTDEICDLDERFRQLTGITREEEANPPAAESVVAYGKTMVWLRKFADVFAPQSTIFGTFVRVLNRLAGLFFFLGILFFALFARENWATMKAAKEESAGAAAAGSKTTTEPVPTAEPTQTAVPNSPSPPVKSSSGDRSDGKRTEGTPTGAAPAKH